MWYVLLWYKGEGMYVDNFTIYSTQNQVRVFIFLPTCESTPGITCFMYDTLIGLKVEKGFFYNQNYGSCVPRLLGPGTMVNALLISKVFFQGHVCQRQLQQPKIALPIPACDSDEP